MSAATRPATATRPAATGRARGAATRPQALPAATAGLRVVPSPAPTPRRAPFVAVVLTLLVVGLGGLLVLNTVLAEGAFRVHDLEAKVAVLADQEQALQQQVAGLAAPARLMQRARALGMVPMSGPAFLRTSDGKILGRPAPAAPAPWLSPPSPVAPTPAPTATATTDPKPEAKTDPKKADTKKGQADQKQGQADQKKADKSSDQPADATSTGAGR